MAPRKYSMKQRRHEVEATRRRIVEATLALHSKRGILGTSWRDIAERADVSVATVYKHFPTLDELMPACGELLVSRTQPPSPDAVDETFAGAATLGERLGRLVATFFDFYERGEAHLEIDVRERTLPLVQEWEAHRRATREAYVRAALQPLTPDDPLVRSISALLDFAVYQSFRRHDVPSGDAAAFMHDLLVRRLAAAGSEEARDAR
jgi:AcrR family transcriptional regulator